MMKLNIQLFAVKKVTSNYYAQAWGGRQQTGYHDSNTFLWIIKVWNVSQSIDTNKTTISCGLYENGTWGSYSGIHSVKGKLQYRIKDSSGTWGSWKTLVDTTEIPSFTKNSTIYAPFSTNDNSKKKFSTSLTLSHNADGTSQHFQLKATISVGNIGQDWYYAPWDASVSTDELYFETIPRASKINSVAINKTAINFNYTKYSTSFTDTVTIKCGDTTLYTLENPLDSAITSTITKELTQSHIDTIVAYGNTNTLTQVPITIETKTMNGSSLVGDVQTITANYILTNSTLETETSYAITNSAISVTPVFTPLSGSNLKHNLILSYGENLTYTFNNISSGNALTLPTNDPNIVDILFKRFRSESSIDIRLTLVTQLESSTTDIGSTSSKTLTLTLPAYTITGNINSIIENATMPTGLSKASNTFIKNLSKMSINFAAKKTDDNATSFYGTSIQYKIGNTLVSSPYIHSYDGTIPTIVAFTDLNDEVSMNISGCNYVNYQFPVCSINALRVDSQGAATQTGDRVKFEITIIYFKEQTQNPLITQYPHETPEFTLRYKEAGQSSWSSFTQSSTTVTTSTDGNIVTKVYTKTLTGMHYNKQLSYELTGEDCLKQTITAITGRVIPGKPGIYGYKDDTTAENYTGINDHLILNGNMQVAVTSQHTGKNIIQGSANHSSTYTNTLPAKSGTFAMTDDHDSTKQDTLVSGTSIKTLNGESLLGSGNIVIQGAETTDVKINNVSITNNAVADIKTKSAYNASTNKIATESDIPTVNNAKLKITKNGNDFIEFTANASSNVTGNIDIPAKVSDLTNDLGFTSNTGTVTGVTAGAGLNTTGDNASSDGGTISTSGTLNLTKSGVTAGTYQGITVDKYGRVTAASNQGYTTNTGTITGVSVNGTSIATSGVANISSLPASILSGAIANGVTATTQSINDNSTKVATTAYVDRAIDNLPEPMVFKGSLGTGGTITSLPTASSSNEGYTYKVITAGTYASQSAKIGDTFISDGSSWVLIPSGDEPSGTVTSITIKATSPISIDSSSAITSSGTRTLSHANSGVTAGTYKSVTVNATGHVTGGSNPTTLSGYGITDAKINNGVITLGSNTITPLTSYTETDPIFSASPAADITAANITAWTNKSDFSGNYNDLTNKPTIPTVNNATLTIQKEGTSVGTFTANASSNKTINIVETDPVFAASAAHGITSTDITNWNNKSTFSGNYNDLSNKPSIPTKTSDLTNDSDFVSDNTYVHTDNNYTTTEKNKLAGIAAGAEVNVQSDWNQTTTTADDYIKNKPTIPTVNNGTLTIQKNGTNVQTFTANQSSNATANITVPTKTSDLTNDSGFITNSGSTTGNAGSATKLETARTIGIGTGATGTATSFNGTSNITIPVTDIKEAYTTWGGKNISGDITAMDMGCVDEFGHNKLAFLPAGCIKVEYTNDGGTTWLDYGLTDAQKIASVTTSGTSITIGKGTVKATDGTLTTANMGNYKIRVTISTRNGAGQTYGALYTQAKKLLINMSNNGATCKCLIENRTIANYNNNADVWTTHGTYDISGWSGWNSIPYNIRFGGSSTQTSQIADLRITMYLTAINTAYACNASLIDFRLIGSTNWSMPSELARAGHLYKLDTDKRAIFPYDIRPETNNVGTLGTSSYKWNNIYATSLTGNLTGNVTGNLTGTASKATGDKNGNDITTTYYKASNPNGYTSNTGTITEITMNGASKGTSGVVDLGTVVTVETDPIFESSPASDISNSDISAWGAKQDALVSGDNIKTINGEPIIGPGNITIGEGGKLLTDVQINARSITPGTTATANIIVDGTYNESTNKIATQSTVASGVAAGLNTIDYITCGNETFRNPFTGTDVTTEVITVGKRNNNVKLKLSNNIVKVALNNNDVVYIGTDGSGKTRIFANNMNALQSIKLGDFSWTKLSDGSIVFGGDE